MKRRLLNLFAGLSLLLCAVAVANVAIFIVAAHYDSVGRQQSASPWLLVAVVFVNATGLLALLRGAFRTRRTVHEAIRRTAGRCPACGYDLRATPERCPECGAGHAAEGV